MSTIRDNYRDVARYLSEQRKPVFEEIEVRDAFADVMDLDHMPTVSAHISRMIRWGYLQRDEGGAYQLTGASQ